MEKYTIRALNIKTDIDPIEKLQEEIWGYGRGSTAPLPYPARCLFEFVESGGLVCGAYSTEGGLIGFSAAWLGRERIGQRRVYLHSQLVGIRPEWRDFGIGMALKLHQRQFAITESLPLVKWTFDPLQSRNAYLNLGKLGGIVREFITDYYGDLTGKLNQGFPTDRFWVEWHVGSAAVRNKLADSCAKTAKPSFPLVNTVDGPLNERQCISVNLDLQDPTLLIEIPPNISELRVKNPAVAMRWQQSYRDIFSSYLNHYWIADCVREADHTFYVLNKQHPRNTQMDAS